MTVMNKSNKFIKMNNVIGLISITLFVLCVCANGQECENCDRTGETLDCSGKSKSTFVCDDKCSVTNIKCIDLSNNLLGNLSYSSCFNNIKVIRISHNNFTELTTAFKKAKEIDISCNSLTGNLSLGKFKYLTNLSATDNKLETIDCHNVKSLRVLDVTRNNIKKIQNCTSLHELRASSNRLEYWNITQLENLTYFDVSSNSHRASEVWNFPLKLTTLLLSHNKLTKRELDDLKNLRSLKVLDLSWTSLDSIPSLELASSVKQVNLSNNNIHVMDIKTLENLIADNNSTSNVFVDLRNNDFSRNEKGIREIVYNSAFVTNSTECSCVNVTTSSLELIFCVNDTVEEQPCWWEEDTLTTTTTTTTTTKASTTAPSPTTQNVQKMNIQVQTMTDSGEANETPSSNESVLSHATYFLQSFGAAKLSFLGFLLFTLIVLIILNCIVGDPVVDDYSWEEKQPSDRPVT